MITCCRCGADLSQPPHSKLYWQGVPRATYATGEKGDLCNPCHDNWLAEQKLLRSEELVRPKLWGNGDGQWKKGEDPL